MAGTERDDLNLREAFELAREALKTLLAINGGAAVAILAFYGQSLSGTGIVGPTARLALADSLYWFAYGAAFVATSFISGYVVQLLWGGAYDTEAAQRRAHKIAPWCHAVGIGCTAASFYSFVMGVSDVRAAILVPPMAHIAVTVAPMRPTAPHIAEMKGLLPATKSGK
jgi:hypothetical protein